MENVKLKTYGFVMDEKESGTFSQSRDVPSMPLSLTREEDNAIGMTATPESSRKMPCTEECVASPLTAVHVVPRSHTAPLAAPDNNPRETDEEPHKLETAPCPTPDTLPTDNSPSSTDDSPPSSATSTTTSASLQDVDVDNGKCGGGPRFDADLSDIEQNNNTSEDGNQQQGAYDRQDTTSSSASSRSQYTLRISADYGVKVDLQGSDETVRRCSADAVSIFHKFTQMKMASNQSSPSLNINTEQNEKSTNKNSPDFVIKK